MIVSILQVGLESLVEQGDSVLSMKIKAIS